MRTVILELIENRMGTVISFPERGPRVSVEWIHVFGTQPKARVEFPEWDATVGDSDAPLSMERTDCFNGQN